jgi:DinB superfamily
MNSLQILKSSMDVCDMVLTKYVSDLSDAEILQRPHAGCNHIAWQIGHLIASEGDLLNSVCPGKGLTLPEGFAAKHSKDNAASNNPADFLTKEEYLALYSKVRANTAAAIASLSESALNGPAPEFLRDAFPHVGDTLVLIATHPLMHSGQFVILRRALGKPVVI